MTDGREIRIDAPRYTGGGAPRLPHGTLKRAALSSQINDWFLIPPVTRFEDSARAVAAVLTRRYAPLRFAARKTPQGVVIRRVA